ncbi:MAG TPA: hypothetical protein PKA70_22375 [Saprospiraceae bacterium]|nr:hypothetical protein [Saprospiraceae bacterium]
MLLWALALPGFLAGQQLQINNTIPAGYVSPDYAFAALDLSGISSGFLADKAIPLADLDKYDGTLNETVNKHSLDFICATLADAAVSSTVAVPIGLVEHSVTSGVIPFNMLFYEYHRIKPTALGDGLVTVSNNQIHPVPGAASPYESRRLFAAAPSLIEGLPSGSYTFDVDIHKNVSQPLLSARINFGNGWQLVQDGSMVTAHFNAPGTVEVIAEIKFLDRTTFLSKSTITILETVSPIVSGQDIYCFGQEFDFTVSTADGNSQATVTALSACCDDQLRKPFIVINGFEADRFEALEAFFGFTFGGLINQLFNMDTPTGNLIIDDLDDSQYDIVFIDFEDETDALEVNAELVMAAIREINLRKHQAGSSEKNVVVGISMGGVVGKLGLRDMELAGEEHETEVFVSFDSPLRGANIPLGFQYMVEHLAELAVGFEDEFELEEFVELLEAGIGLVERPSPTQMLIYNKDHFPAPAPEFEAFYTMFKSKGALTQCEHIAISNGSQIGIDQGYAPNDKYLDVDGDAFDFLAFQEINLNFFLELFIRLGLNAEVDFEIRAVPGMDNEFHRVYKGQVNAELFGFIDVNFTYNEISVKNTIPLDNAPGGFLELPGPLDFGLPEDIFDNPPIQLLNRRFCFIPSISAIEVGPFVASGAPLLDPFTDISNNQTVLNSGNTTVSRYIAVDDDPDPSTHLDNNQLHPEFSFDNSGVLLSAILNTTGVGSPLVNRTYNFGDANTAYDYQANPPTAFSLSRTPAAIDENLEINSGGNLWINRSGRIAYTDVTNNPSNATVSQMDVYIRLGCGPQTLVEIQDGGQCIIGEWNDAAGINNAARLVVEDAARLDIYQGGSLLVNHESELVVEDGGVVTLLAGGLAEAQFGGKIRVEAGGELRVLADATLRVNHYSEFILEAGGRLVIEPGANIEMFDGTDPLGRPRIKVMGELVIGGEFDFEGNGYFDFYPDHTLTLESGLFSLEGGGYGYRFIKLQAGTTLQIGGSRIQLYDGRVEYEYQSEIRVGSSGEAVFSGMELVDLSDGDATGLYLQGAALLRVVSSGFYDFNYAIEGYEVFTSNLSVDFMVSQTQFINNINSIWIDGGSTLRVEQCDLLAGAQGSFALFLRNLAGARLSGSYVSGYDAPAGMLESWGAIHLADVPEFIVTGGVILNNEVGIYCPVPHRTNVFLRGGVSVQNNYYGIHIEAGGIGANNVDHGLVMMDCAKLLNNQVGIKGQDILLQIDAIENSGTNDPTYLRANHFQNGSASSAAQLFQICYVQRNDITTVSAQGNYWGTDNANPTQVDYILQKAQNGCGGSFSDISLNTGNQVANAPSGCPAFPPDGPGTPVVPLEKECVLQQGQLIQETHEIYKSGHRAFSASIDADELTYTARQEYQPAASVPNSKRNTSTQVCKHYIDISRVMVEMDNMQEALLGGNNSQYLQLNETNGLVLAPQQVMKVLPNPAKERFTILAMEGIKYIRVFNVLGVGVYESEFGAGAHDVSVKDWSPGTYVVEALMEDGTLVRRTLVVAQ